MVAICGREWQQCQNKFLINGGNQRRPRGGMVDTKDLKSVASLLRHRINIT